MLQQFEQYLDEARKIRDAKKTELMLANPRMNLPNRRRKRSAIASEATHVDVTPVNLSDDAECIFAGLSLLSQEKEERGISVEGLPALPLPDDLPDISALPLPAIPDALPAADAAPSSLVLGSPCKVLIPLYDQ